MSRLSTCNNCKTCHICKHVSCSSFHTCKHLLNNIVVYDATGTWLWCPSMLGNREANPCLHQPTLSASTSVSDSYMCPIQFMHEALREWAVHGQLALLLVTLPAVVTNVAVLNQQCPFICRNNMQQKVLKLWGTR